MNKIEIVIEKTELELKRLTNNQLCINAKIEAIKDQLQLLKSINENKTIPHL